MYFVRLIFAQAMLSENINIEIFMIYGKWKSQKAEMVGNGN